MKNPSIKESRERDAVRLAERQNENPTPEQIEEARRTMTKYYRFVAAYQRSFYTEQSRTASEAEKAAADDKSERAHKRAAEALKNYRLRISCPGLYPIIEEENGINFTYGYFYN